MVVLEWSRIQKFWNGQELKKFGRVQKSKSLEGSRIQKSGIVHDLKILEWSKLWKFWNGLDCNFFENVQFMKFLNVPELETS